MCIRDSTYTTRNKNESISLVVDEYLRDFSAVRNILKIDGLDKESIHIGGALFFDSLGNLYLTTGDGGPQGDPENHSQNLESLRGKILRLDVSKPTLEPKIIAYGFRNPWGASIDSNDRIFISDCGWSNIESVYLLSELDPEIPSNYGWPIFEGSQRMRKGNTLMFQDTVSPIYQYVQRPGCGVGGFYLDDLELFVFADFHGTVRMLKQKKNGQWYLFHEYKQENYIWGLGFNAKTNKIFVKPNGLELKISLEPFNLDEQLKFCETTMPDGYVNNNDCN